MRKSIFAFVILHYLDFKVTKQCVESITKTLDYDSYYIVIVDNASPNKSGEELQRIYEENERICIIMRKENDGFANGNNEGFRYAKEKLNANFIICINNDTILEQKDFLEKIEKIYTETECSILGPDIWTPTNERQNPRRATRLTYKEVKKNILRKQILLWYCYWKKYFSPIRLIEQLIEKSDISNREIKKGHYLQEDVVLLGACIIYCPNFVENEIYAFSPKTFMYGEEDLLAWYCSIKNYKTIYSPEIKIIHLSGVSTKKSAKSEINKDIFLYRYAIKGLKLLKKEMKFME